MLRLMCLRAARRVAFSLAVLTCVPFSLGTAVADDKSDVLVTASRVSESLDDTLWSSDVLTRADIESRQSLSVQDVLADLAGVQFGNLGGLGKATSMFLRGTNSTQTLLLVNGIRMGSATVGAPPWELLPLEEIDRIEVVRGPRSTLYGSDAMGGVVQIFTRSGRQPGFSVDASVTGGTYSTFQESAGLHAGGERVWFDAGGSVQHTAGFNACYGDAATFAGCGTYQPDRDGFLKRSGSVALGGEWSGWTAQLQGLISSGNTRFDGTYADNTDFAEQQVSLRIDGHLSEKWQLHLMGGRSEDDAHDFLGDVAVDRFQTWRDSASVQLDGALASALRLVGGADYVHDHVQASVPVYQPPDFMSFVFQDYDRTSRDTTGEFLELHGTAGPWTGLAGFRYEHNQQFGDHSTGNLGAGWKLSPHLRLTATWGTAFHAPTFNDLYYPGGFGNPALKPEVSHSTEFGIEGLEHALRWSVRAFQTNVSDLIVFDSVTSLPQNIDQARIRGIELSSEWRADVWSVNGQVTLLDPVDRATDNVLPRRAKVTATLDVRRAVGKASLGAVARWQGLRYDDVDNTVPLGGYLTLDLLGEVPVGSFVLAARIANALGRDYHTAAFYNQPGREFNLTVRYRFVRH
jgi:vitamin B12 transporter